VKRVVLIYIGLFVIMVAAMIGVTMRMLDLERSEQRQALSAESERLALWRMESQLLPLVLEESTRDYTELAAHRDEPDPSPSTALCYFRCDASGKIDDLWLDSKRAAEETQMESIPTVMRLIASDVRQPQFFAALGELIPTEDTILAQNELTPAPQSAEPEPLENYAQQALRSQNEFQRRTANTATTNAQFLNQMQRLSGEDRPATADRNPMTAFWIEDRLYLARNLGGGKIQQAEGCLLDWDQLKPTLIETIHDLLPDADLVPLAPDEPGDHQTLANLPIRLIPGDPVLSNLPVSSPLKPTLIVAWTCFLLSAAALGGLLFGVVRLSERRAAFVSAVTHELRTPLTTLRLYSDLLANRESLSHEKYDRYIETLKNEAERLEYLIENVLSWSRLERSAETQLIEEIDWTDFLERIESSLRDRAGQAGMTLEITAEENETPVRFRGNRTAVERILFNLIDNSCKYAKQSDDKRIHVDLQQDDRTVRICVRDHGPGIAPEVRSRLFQPFTKSAQEAARSAPGIGLGLSLSRRLARDMQGDLVLKANSTGETAFELQLPRSG
jgi:signal transduction histidine kinase